MPQLLIDIDRDRAARYGLNVSDIQDVIEAALAGKAATNLWEGERKFAVAVRLPSDERTIANLPRTPIATPDGGYVQLGDVAKIRESLGRHEHRPRGRPPHHGHRHLHRRARHGLRRGRHEGPRGKEREGPRQPTRSTGRASSRTRNAP